MNLPRRLSLLLLTTTLAACASYSGPMMFTNPDLPRIVGEGTPVTVHWGDPAQFTEIRQSLNRYEAVQGDWVVELGDYVSERVARSLPPGQRADVEILDIKRAGEYEWWVGRTDDVRIMRDIYPPRMRVQYVRYDANGQVIGEGEQQFGDLAYLDGPQPLSTADSLRYEKRMIDRWVQREFGEPITRR